MNGEPSLNPRFPASLLAPAPAHFRARDDLIEELCVPEAFARTLPRTKEAHAQWLVHWGLSAAEAPFEVIQPFIGRPYEPTLRYILHPAIFPGSELLFNIMTDGRGWSVCCEPGGLFSFVIDRAVEFVVGRGYERERMRGMFHPKIEHNPGPKLRHGWWAVSYERTSGFCTIVPHDKLGAGGSASASR